jgi:hypothetical protein
MAAFYLFNWLNNSLSHISTCKLVQTKKPGRENYLVWWYHRHMTTATAQSSPNIAFIK